MKMVELGKYPEAVEILKKYRIADVLILPAIAYCYLVPALKTGENISSEELIRGPTPAALAAREQRIELVRLKPPVKRLKEMGIGDDPGINKIFWFMLKQAIEWFPSEREFLRIGIEKATKDGRKDIREELLSRAIERFFDDMFFLRDAYKLKLESRDAAAKPMQGADGLYRIRVATDVGLFYRRKPNGGIEVLSLIDRENLGRYVRQYKRRGHS